VRKCPSSNIGRRHRMASRSDPFDRRRSARRWIFDRGLDWRCIGWWRGSSWRGSRRRLVRSIQLVVVVEVVGLLRLLLL